MRGTEGTSELAQGEGTGDTQPSITDVRTTAPRPRTPSSRTTRGFLSALVPRFDETITPEFYRLSGKLRAFTNALFIVANLVMAPQVDRLGFDPAIHLRTALSFTAIHLLDLVLAVVLWRATLNMRGMRALTFISVILETGAVVAASWVYGSVNSPFIGIALMFIVINRLAFDMKVGVTAFAILVVGYWGVVGAELAGWIPPQPIAPHGMVDAVYGAASRQIGAMINLSVAFALAFVAAHWAIVRMHNKDIAIRLLRESLFAIDRARGDGGGGGAVRVGRHTGRTLRASYLLGDLLGVGGMGEVYRATHLRTRRRVAVKMLHPHLVEDPTVLSRFRREAEITGKLGSEHIVEVLDVDEDDGQPFLVFELIEGESLGARISTRGPLPLADVAEIVAQVARGLDVAHRAGVVHRDLKPENIFLTPRANGLGVKILDFGVSKIGGNATAITQEVAILGTPDYMSPEQATGHAEDVDAASDVFSLGAITYAMLTGRRPFDSPSVPALLRKICDEEPASIGEVRDDVPVAVVDVVAIAMAKHPAQRYAGAIELAADLAAAAAGTADGAIGDRARAVTRGRPASRRIKRDSINTTGQTQPA